MAERLRLFAFGLQNGFVLFLATAVVVVLGLIGLGYITQVGFKLPTSVAVNDAATLIDHAIAVLNTSNIWSNAFFLAAQTCLVFVALQLTRYLYGRNRIVASVRQNVKQHLSETIAAAQGVQSDQQELGLSKATYLKDLNDENGLNAVRERLAAAIGACDALESECENLAEYLMQLEISSNLQEVGNVAEAAADAFRAAQGVQRIDSYLSRLAQGRQSIDSLLQIDLKIG